MRVFDAPRELVWKEWTEPERFADWFGGTQSEVPLEHGVHGRPSRTRRESGWGMRRRLDGVSSNGVHGRSSTRAPVFTLRPAGEV